MDLDTFHEYGLFTFHIQVSEEVWEELLEFRCIDKRQILDEVETLSLLFDLAVKESDK